MEGFSSPVSAGLAAFILEMEGFSSPLALAAGILVDDSRAAWTLAEDSRPAGSFEVDSRAAGSFDELSSSPRLLVVFGASLLFDSFDLLIGLLRTVLGAWVERCKRCCVRPAPCQVGQGPAIPC